MALPSSLLAQGVPSLLFSSPIQVSEADCRLVVTPGKRSLVRCLAKKKISFVDQILDYIEGTFMFLFTFVYFSCKHDFLNQFALCVFLMF